MQSGLAFPIRGVDFVGCLFDLEAGFVLKTKIAESD